MGVVGGGALGEELNIFKSGGDGFVGGGELNELRFELNWFGIVVGVIVLGAEADGLN